MKVQTTQPQNQDALKKTLESWFATQEGSEALHEVLDRIVKTTEELQVDRIVDAQLVERPVTL